MSGGDGAVVAWVVAALFAVAALVLGVLLARTQGQRRELRDWLADPDRDVPEGDGNWREVFSRLQRLRKEIARTHADLRVDLDRLRQAVQALPDGVVLLDTRDRIEWFNPAAAGHFDLDVARDVGTLAEQLIRYSQFHAFLASFRAGSAINPLILPIGVAGARRVLSVSLHAFADTGTLLLSRDVSEIAKTEIIRRDFVANVSHELRTPLTVITGFLEQFSSEEPPAGAQARRFLDLMTTQAARMNRLLEDLLTLSLLENDTYPVREESVNVPVLLESLVVEARALSGDRHAITIAEADAGDVTGSTDEIRSAFGNLITNAVRYTPSCGTITLRWRLEDACPVFSVADSGIGIPAEHIPRLTERFYRVDKSRSSSTGGTGLGLAIVKHVLARHGGTLAIESQVGSGSTFIARFPEARRIN